MGRVSHVKVNADGHELRLVLSEAGDISLDGRRIKATLTVEASGTSILRVGGKPRRIYLKKNGDDQYEIWINHSVVNVVLSDERTELLERFGTRQHSAHASATVRAPMPGIVASVTVKPGDSVEAGSALLILEAMKMENEIHSHVRGKVKSIFVKEKMTVEKDQPLLAIEST